MLYQYSFTLHFYCCGFFTLLLLSVFLFFCCCVFVFCFFFSSFGCFLGRCLFCCGVPPPPTPPFLFFFFFFVAVMGFSLVSFFFICCGIFSFVAVDVNCAVCVLIFSCLILICTLQWFILSLIFCRAVTVKGTSFLKHILSVECWLSLYR